MPIEFPSNPVNGQVYTFGSHSWTYDSSVPGWQYNASTTGGGSGGAQVVRVGNPPRVRSAERWRLFGDLALEDGAEVILEDGAELQLL
jgi:hypothetical protein